MMPRNCFWVPTAPLQEYLNSTVPDGIWGQDNERRSLALGISIGYYKRLKYRNEISWIVADRLATNLGRHPKEIWTDWYELTDR
jgi:hypothetical protein